MKSEIKLTPVFTCVSLGALDSVHKKRKRFAKACVLNYKYFTSGGHMGEKYDTLNDNHKEFIVKQKLFFIATAAPSGTINVSPKGMDTFRVIDSNRVLWMNLTGSGNETAAHLLELNRMTIMFCSFEKSPLILRLYGTAKTIQEGDKDWVNSLKLFPNHAGPRQIFDMSIDLVHSSCGYGVPMFSFTGERDLLQKWAQKKGSQGVHEYWKEKNSKSLDGKDTGIPFV